MSNENYRKEKTLASRKGKLAREKLAIAVQQPQERESLFLSAELSPE
jgi:hypothetical protein